MALPFYCVVSEKITTHLEKNITHQVLLGYFADMRSAEKYKSDLIAKCFENISIVVREPWFDDYVLE